MNIQSQHGLRGRGVAARRRGSVYLLVLGVCAIVMVIGMSAMAAVRVRHAGTAGREDAAQAQQLADAALRIAFARIAGDAAWRTTYTHDVWTTPEGAAQGAYRFRIVDEDDADLSDDADDAFRLYARAEVGDAVRVVSVQVVPYTPLGPEILQNPGFESGVPAPWVPALAGQVAIALDTASPAEGSQALHIYNRTASIYGSTQDLRGLIQPQTTYRVAAWVRMKDSPATARVGLAIETFLMIPEYKTLSAAIGTGWTYVTGNIQTGNIKSNPAYLNWQVDTTASTQEFWIDGASIREVLGDCPYCVIRGSYRRELDL